MTKPDLAQLLPAFKDEFPVLLQPANETVDRDQLFVDLGKDEQSRSRFLELIFLPAEEDQLYFLQMFVALPFYFEPAQAPDLALLIANLNLKLPLVGFGMYFEQNLPVFRAIIPCPAHELDAELIIATSWVINYQIDLFSDLIEKLATGQWTLDQALAEADALFAAPPMVDAN